MERKDKYRQKKVSTFNSSNTKIVTSLDEETTQQSTTQCGASFVSKTTMFSRSGTSSSSQEESEITQAVTNQYLLTARVESARSMESLRPRKDASPARPASSCTRVHRSSFLTASERDVRETRGGQTRRALSGEEVGAAEKKRGLFASSERRALQQLSLPPPERRLTILSPHSPLGSNMELQWPAPSGIRGRRKKGMVLPKLILPRNDSDGSDVFSERLR